MKIYENIKDIKTVIKNWKIEGKTLGLVPTMGYLHEGHASLVKESVKNNDKTIVSLFVNPTQFGPNEDLASYPRDMKRDKELLESLDVDIVFNPSPEEMYGKTPLTKVYVEDMSSKLCGVTRPIHFGGVATVVSKLFNIINPNRAYFGSKDFQQLQIIKKMVNDLNFDIEIIGMPIVREKDGLALSSRNIYLKPEEREAALTLSKSLALAEKLIEKGEREPKKIIAEMTKLINSANGTKIDYINIVCENTLENLSEIKAEAVILLAVYIGKTRLIDNKVIRKS